MPSDISYDKARFTITMYLSEVFIVPAGGYSWNLNEIYIMKF